MKKNEGNKNLISSLSLYKKGINLPETAIRNDKLNTDIKNKCAIDPSDNYAVIYVQEQTPQSTSHRLHLYKIHQQGEGCVIDPLALKTVAAPHCHPLSSNHILKFLSPQAFVLIDKTESKIYYYETKTLKLKKSITLPSADSSIADMVKIDSNLHIILSVKNNKSASEALFMNDRGNVLRRLKLKLPYTCATTVTYRKNNNRLFFMDKTGNYAIVKRTLRSTFSKEGAKINYQNYLESLLASEPILATNAISATDFGNPDEFHQVKPIRIKNFDGVSPDEQWVTTITTQPDRGRREQAGLRTKVIFYHIELDKSYSVNSRSYSDGSQFSDAHSSMMISNALNALDPSLLSFLTQDAQNNTDDEENTSDAKDTHGVLP